MKYKYLKNILPRGYNYIPKENKHYLKYYKKNMLNYLINMRLFKEFNKIVYKCLIHKKK